MFLSFYQLMLVKLRVKYLVVHWWTIHRYSTIDGGQCDGYPMKITFKFFTEVLFLSIILCLANTGIVNVLVSTLYSKPDEVTGYECGLYSTKGGRLKDRISFYTVGLTMMIFDVPCGMIITLWRLPKWQLTCCLTPRSYRNYSYSSAVNNIRSWRYNWFENW